MNVRLVLIQQLANLVIKDMILSEKPVLNVQNAAVLVLLLYIANLVILAMESIIISVLSALLELLSLPVKFVKVTKIFDHS